eukprot:scpid108284/ scgid33390/ 
MDVPGLGTSRSGQFECIAHSDYSQCKGNVEAQAGQFFCQFLQFSCSSECWQACCMRLPPVAVSHGLMSADSPFFVLPHAISDDPQLFCFLSPLFEIVHGTVEATN